MNMPGDSTEGDAGELVFALVVGVLTAVVEFFFPEPHGHHRCFLTLPVPELSPVFVLDASPEDPCSSVTFVMLVRAETMDRADFCA